MRSIGLPGFNSTDSKRLALEKLDYPCARLGTTITIYILIQNNFRADNANQFFGDDWRLMSASESIGPEWILEETYTNAAESERVLLRECSRRLWPGLKAFARRVMTAEISREERDNFSAQIWQEVLVLTAKSLSESKRPILSLESYLSASFRYRFLRKAKQEKKLRDRIQFLPPEELAELEDTRIHHARITIDDRLQVEQIIQQMDDWTLTVWNLLVFEMSWKEVGKAINMEPEQAKQKFRYDLKKIRDRLKGKTGR
jgi:hypothetical protein